VLAQETSHGATLLCEESAILPQDAGPLHQDFRQSRGHLQSESKPVHQRILRENEVENGRYNTWK
jgi:hypothetical protein